MGRKQKQGDQVTESIEKGRQYRAGALRRKQLTPEQQEERRKMIKEWGRERYLRLMATEEGRRQIADKAKKYRADHREENRAYMAEYMRNYRRKQAEKKQAEKLAAQQATQ